jgi:hypothetical protein
MKKHYTRWIKPLVKKDKNWTCEYAISYKNPQHTGCITLIQTNIFTGSFVEPFVDSLPEDNNSLTSENCKQNTNPLSFSSKKSVVFSSLQK